MLVFAKIKSIRQEIDALGTTKSIGFVPTMGALHEGHLSLIKRAKKENDVVVVSIFVNPTQFDNIEDLKNYPSTVDEDLDRLESLGCDLVFAPSSSEVYKSDIRALQFDFDGLDTQMEGKHRKGHFDGVGTIVKHLFEIVQPSRAYFGEKDFQQLQIIRKLVALKNMPIDVIGCPIFREADGLAMSSRNVRLSEEQRKAAPFIYKTLEKASAMFKKATITEVIQFVESEFEDQQQLELAYFEVADESSLQPSRLKEMNKKYRAFIAVFAGKIRLIDNISL